MREIFCKEHNMSPYTAGQNKQNAWKCFLTFKQQCPRKASDRVKETLIENVKLLSDVVFRVAKEIKENAKRYRNKEKLKNAASAVCMCVL